MGTKKPLGAQQWALMGTALVGLAIAVAIFVAKYYEARKARAEALKAEGDDNPRGSALTSSKPAGKGSSIESPSIDDSQTLPAGSTWEGLVEQGTNLRSRLHIDESSDGRFRAIKTDLNDGVELAVTRARGTISNENDIELKTRVEDQVSGNKITPTRFRAIARGKEIIGSWQADTGPSASFKLVRQ